MFEKISAYLRQASKPQLVIEGCSIIIALAITAWCVVNNVDPVVDDKDVTRQHLALVQGLYDRAQREDDLFSQSYFCQDSRGYHAHDRRQCVNLFALFPIDQLTDPDARSLLNTRQVLDKQDIADNQRLIDAGCDDDFVCVECDSGRQYTKQCADLWADHSIKFHPALRAVNKSLSDMYWRKNRAADVLHDQLIIAKGQYEFVRWEENEAKRVQAQETADLDAKFMKTDRLGKMMIVLEETVAQSWRGWAWVAGISLVGIFFAWVMGTLGGNIRRKGNLTIFVPVFPFGRPIANGDLGNWKLVVDFHGRTFLQDKDGSRINIEHDDQSLMVLSEPSLARVVANADVVDKTRRLLVMAVEAMRKSVEFQRSQVIKTVRQNILVRITEELPPSDPIHAEINRRREEEEMSDTKLHVVD